MTTNRIKHAPVTPCASLVFAPAVIAKLLLEITPATFIPPASPEQMFATPCATNSLFESHASPSLSAQKRHTAAPSRYVMTPMAMPGTARAERSSAGTPNAAGGHSDETSTEMLPTTPPTSTPLNLSKHPKTQHTSAEGNSLWIFVPFSIIAKVAAANRAVPGCQVSGCVRSQNAAVAKCPDAGPDAGGADHRRYLTKENHPGRRADEALKQRHGKRGHHVPKLRETAHQPGHAAVHGEHRGACDVRLRAQRQS